MMTDWRKQKLRTLTAHLAEASAQLRIVTPALTEAYAKAFGAMVDAVRKAAERGNHG